MQNMSDKLDTMVVRTTSPDGLIMANLRRLRTTISFRSNAYTQYTPQVLEYQLAAMLDAVWEGRRSGVREVFAQADALVERPAPHWDRKVRDYRQALSELEFRGKSSNNHIKVRCVDLRDFEVRIRPEALDELSEAGFVAEFHSALTELTADKYRKTAQLKDSHLDMKRPDGMVVSIARFTRNQESGDV